MGYYSEVVIKMPQDKYVELEARYKEAGFTYPKLEELSTHEGVVTLHYPYVKWYEDDPAVQHIMIALKALPEEDYAFLRVGESDDDVEDHGSPCNFGVHLNRSISF